MYWRSDVLPTRYVCRKFSWQPDFFRCFSQEKNFSTNFLAETQKHIKCLTLTLPNVHTKTNNPFLWKPDIKQCSLDWTGYTFIRALFTEVLIDFFPNFLRPKIKLLPLILIKIYQHVWEMEVIVARYCPNLLNNCTSQWCVHWCYLWTSGSLQTKDNKEQLLQLLQRIFSYLMSEANT